MCQVGEGAFLRRLIHLGVEIMTYEASLPGCTTRLIQEVIQILPQVRDSL